MSKHAPHSKLPPPATEAVRPANLAEQFDDLSNSARPPAGHVGLSGDRDPVLRGPVHRLRQLPGHLPGRLSRSWPPRLRQHRRDQHGRPAHQQPLRGPGGTRGEVWAEPRDGGVPAGDGRLGHGVPGPQVPGVLPGHPRGAAALGPISLRRVSAPATRAALLRVLLLHDRPARPAHGHRDRRLVAIAFLAHRGRYTAEYYTPVEVVGLYWHFVDIVWIFILPTLYLVAPA